MANPFSFIRSINRKVEQRSVDITAVPSVNYGPVVVASSEAATKIAAVYSAVKLISEGVARIPLRAKYYNQYKESFSDDVKNPIYDLLTVAPNPRETAYNMIQAAVAQMLLKGNAYIVPKRNAVGQVVELTLLYPDTVTYDELHGTYTINDPYNGLSGVYTADELVHLKNPSLVNDGRLGESTIRQAAKTLGIAVAANNEVEDLFQTGSRYRGIITGDESQTPGFGKLAEKQVSTVRDRVVDELRKGEHITYLPNGSKFTPFSMTPADVQLLENRKFSVKEIARFFRVSPSLLYEDGGSTYSNAETEQVHFLNNTLEPILYNIESEFKMKLINRNDWTGRRFEFDRQVLYTTDLTTEANYMKATIEAGVMTINDWRRKKGLSTVKGGDTILVSANTVTLNDRINGQ